MSDSSGHGSAEVVLDVRNIEMSASGTTILIDVSFQLERGRAISVVGPSGSGKSTLLRCLNRLERISSGSVLLGGVHTDALPAPALRSRIGLVSQKFALFGHLDALANVTLGLRRTRHLSKPAADEQAREWLNRVGLAGLEKRRPHELSGGQQQRVAIARAAALEPDVLLLDEVTSALDPELVEEVENVVLGLARSGTSLVVVTHEISFAAKVADIMLMMEAGQVVETGSPQDVLASSRPRSQRFFSRHLRGWGDSITSVGSAG
ncbi:ATP-binding cassette domain-containing protein [Streptomyces sp. NPDC005917]|uniref:amino acid ABC transporter ATP-binding protein n=1 Tax=unclassified Streptomyces TaxID=2593676 RepID=UPI0033EFD359